MPAKPFVLFVCKHNTGRSQMTEEGVEGATRLTNTQGVN